MIPSAAAIVNCAASIRSRPPGRLFARLVQTRRQANHVFYRVANEHVGQLVEDAIYHAEHTAGGIPEHHRGQAELSELHSAEQ